MPALRENSRGEDPWRAATGAWEPGHVKAAGTEAAHARASRKLDIALLQLKAAVGYAKLDRKLETFKQAFYTFFAETYGEPYAPKAYDPNQPRVPAGNPDGGQWTRVGSPGGSLGEFVVSDTNIGQVIRVAQGRRRNRTTDAEGTLAQVTRRDVTEALASEAVQRVQRLDPSWRPSPSLESRNSIVGQIRRAEENLREAQARLRELEQQRGPQAIQTLREGYGTDLLGRPLLGDTDTVAHGVMDGQSFMGVNSGAIVEYSPQDLNDAKRVRRPLIEKYPKIMSTDNVGRRPNDALFHAESTVLLRTARANGGSLAGKTIEVTVDKDMCRSCEAVLPKLGLELGNPTVTFRDLDGNIVGIMRDGDWLD